MKFPKEALVFEVSGLDGNEHWKGKIAEFVEFSPSGMMIFRRVEGGCDFGDGYVWDGCAYFFPEELSVLNPLTQAAKSFVSDMKSGNIRGHNLLGVGQRRTTRFGYEPM